LTKNRIIDIIKINALERGEISSTKGVDFLSWAVTVYLYG
jgi:hypothetical protein